MQITDDVRILTVRQMTYKQINWSGHSTLFKYTRYVLLQMDLFKMTSDPFRENYGSNKKIWIVTHQPPEQSKR
jgi:hypothetical protein